MPGCLHQRAFIKGGFSHALLCHSQKELYIPCPVPWGWHPLCTGSMRGKLFPQLTKCPNWMVRGEAIWGELKVKWSQECPCGFLQNLLIKAAGISSWLTRFRYVSQVLQSNFFLFSFTTCAKYQSLENTGKIVCFSFCSFLRFLLKMGFGLNIL